MIKANYQYYYPEAHWRNPEKEVAYNEEENTLTATLEMPGIQKEDISIKTSENKIFITAQTGKRKFKRNYRLRYKPDVEKITADYEDGILTLTVKPEELVSVQIPIN